MGDEITETHYNEHVNFNAVMNGDVLHAGTAWHQSTLYGGNAGYLGNASASNSRRMSQFATMQLLRPDLATLRSDLGQLQNHAGY